MARILSVWLPRWPITVWRRSRTGAAVSPETPAALVVAERGVRRLHAVNAAAAGLGLKEGQKAADASALVPGLVLDDADPAGDDAALERLVDWCCRFSPAVAKDAPDGMFLDVEGVAHLWGGEAELMADMVERLAALGVSAKAALADTAGGAWAIARYGEDSTIVGGEILLAPATRGRGRGEGGRASARQEILQTARTGPDAGKDFPRRGRVAPLTYTSPPRGGGEELEAALSSLPVASLRLSEQDAAQLVRLGASKVSHLLSLPRAGLARRFGKMALIRLDQALGAYPEALKYRRSPTPWFERLALVEPISTPEDVARVAQDLAALMCERLSSSERAARRFDFAFHRVDGTVKRVEIGLSRAGREVKPLVRLLRPKLEEIDPGFGIELGTVAAHEVERLSPSQTALAETENEKARVAVAGLIDSLSNRLGPHRVWRARANESHVPERAVLRRRAGEEAGDGWDPETPRPVRLFKRPEPIEATALLPDDPPLQFRWRGRLHRVRLAEGPERIGDEWWRRQIETVSTGRVRDYYRVEDEEGGRYWVFRAGMEGGAKWWLHGVFA